MSISWDVTEINQLAAHLLTAPARLNVGARAATIKSLHDIENTGSGLSPVLSGRLAASWSTQVDSDGLGGEVGPTVDYAPYVEYGTSDTAPQPSLGPAVNAVEPRYLSGLGDAIEVAL